MTDLAKGIVEINGYEIKPQTNPIDVENNLKGSYAYHVVSKNGKVHIFTFKNINVFDRRFDIDVTFVRQSLSTIELASCYGEDLSYVGRFKADCEWLKNVLGEPTQAGTNGVVYKFDSAQIGVTLWENDGRSGSNEIVQISYC